MEHSVLGQVGRAFSLWGQACLVLLRNPQLLVLQVAVAFLLTFLRFFARQVFSFLSTSHVHLIVMMLMFGCLYFFNAFLSHYTMHYVQNQRVRYKESFFSALHSYKQLFVYLLLFMPFVLLFLYDPRDVDGHHLSFAVLGQKLFFASLGIERFTQYINISVARILFVLLVVLLLFLFIVQHIALAIVAVRKSSSTLIAKRAFSAIRSNLVICIVLTCLLFLTCFLFLTLLRKASLTIPTWLDLTMAYYIMTVSLNLYCMALTILYYDSYVKHERASQ